VRKSSDIIRLLSPRGRSRSSGGFGKSIRGLFDSWFGRSRWRDDRQSRLSAVPGWLALAGVLLAFTGGFFVGGSFRQGAVPGGDALNATPKGNTPGFVGEEDDFRPVTSNGLVVSAYANVAEPQAKAKAKALSQFLRDKGFAKARPYRYEAGGQAGSIWMVAVYYDGEAEQNVVSSALRALPDDVPDEHFKYYRNSDRDWPAPFSVR